MQASDAPQRPPRREADRMTVIGASLNSSERRDRQSSARSGRTGAIPAAETAIGAETRAREAGQFATLAQMPPPADQRQTWHSPLLLLPLAALLGAFLGVVTLAWPEGGNGSVSQSDATPATFRAPSSNSTASGADTGFKPAPYGIGAGKRVEALPPPENARSAGAELAPDATAKVAAQAPSAEVAAAPAAKLAEDTPADAAASVVAYGEVKARALESAPRPSPPEKSVATAQSLPKKQVLDVQRRLLRLGFAAGEADGIYGPRASGAMAE